MGCGASTKGNYGAGVGEATKLEPTVASQDTTTTERRRSSQDRKSSQDDSSQVSPRRPMIGRNESSASIASVRGSASRGSSGGRNRRSSKMLDMEEGKAMKRQSSIKTNVELWFMDGIPELYGVADADHLRVELREEGQAEIVDRCLQGDHVKSNAREILMQWLHDAPNEKTRQAFVDNALQSMMRIYGEDPAVEAAEPPRKIHFAEDTLPENNERRVDRVATGHVKFNLPEEDDEEEEATERVLPLKRKGTGIVSQQQLRSLMMQDYEEEDDEESDQEDKDDEAFDASLPKYQDRTQRGTRFARNGVCAEVQDDDPDWEPPKHDKSVEQQARLTKAVASCFMFAALGPEQLNRLIDAFEEVRVEQGEKVISEGDKVLDHERGLYVLEDGQLDVHKADQEGRVFTYTRQGDLFGDLALLYNAPRAATVVAVKPSVLWCLDRATFNNMVKNELKQAKERRLAFLRSVPVLKSLDPDQIAKLADALRERIFGEGVSVIHEGDDGDEFFILESGTCAASKGGERICEYGPAQYFGELALLEDQKRAAQVSTLSPSTLLSLDRASFDRMLGPLKALMKEHATATYS